MIRLSVPGTLFFRDVAIRVVASACKLLRPVSPEIAARADEFDSQVLSAFGEAFNNVAIHGYRTDAPGEVEIEIDGDGETLLIRMRDDGSTFDFPAEVEQPEELPERGMGLFIIRSFMDDVTYCPGPPNVLTMGKRWLLEAAEDDAADSRRSDDPGDSTSARS